MKRRNFMALSATALAALALPTSCLSTDYTSHVSAMAKPDPLSKFCNDQELKKIGASYRTKTDSENEISAIGHHLFKNDKGSTVDAKPELVTSLINQKISDDFEKQNTVVINGWVISRTEARVCALLSMS